jgi:hydrogenase maturation protein HypF
MTAYLNYLIQMVAFELHPDYLSTRYRREQQDIQKIAVQHYHVRPSVISRKLHQTLIHMFAELCAVIRKDTGLSRVVLSDGVFQNSILLNGLIKVLEKENFKVFAHTQVPTNDGGICLGQAMVAAAVTG